MLSSDQTFVVSMIHYKRRYWANSDFEDSANAAGYSRPYILFFLFGHRGHLTYPFTTSFVGTPGLGYPLLLYTGKKSFVVILNYVQQPDPCGPEALFTRQRSRTRPLVGKGPGAPRVPEEAGAQPEQPEAPDLPWRSGSPRNLGPPV